MSLLHFIKLLFKSWKLLLFIPLALAASVYYFTKKEIKVYSSETVVYTGIASGYTLNGSNRADYFATSNAFDNLLNIINSRETRQEVAVKLLSEHLSLKQHEASMLSWAAYQSLQMLVADSVKKRVVKSTLAGTFQALNEYMQSNENNVIYKTINSDNPFYSLNALRSINALRLNSSDLIKISYSTQDAAICKRTLELLEETFMRKQKLLREGQTESVIAYFEAETNKSFAKLDSAEKLFLDFNKSNEIINYYEQTKAVAGEREHLYALNHVLEMDRMANSSALTKIDHDLEGRAQHSLFGSQIIDHRKELSDVYNTIALYETMGNRDSGVAKNRIDSLKKRSVSVEKSLRNTVDQLYIQSTTPGGIPSKEMLDEWLKTTVAFEQSKARLGVMDKRKKEFQVEYSKFAPLGAMLKKIERQISVAEQAYLEMLHGLNLARLTQQNNELTSKLTVIDPPYLPLKANPSTRTMMIAVSFVGGFVLVLAILLLQFLVNKTLLEPIRGARRLGIPLVGIFPLLHEGKLFIQKANLRLLQQLLATVDTTKMPIVIGFISIQNKEGKTELINRLQKGMNDLGFSTAHINWTNSTDSKPGPGKITFIEFPALEQYVYAAGNLPHLDYVMLVCRANRIWNKIDKDLLSNFTKTSGTTAKAILNGVDTDFAEEYIGEKPTKRSSIRAVIKRVLKFQFGNRNTITKKKVKNDFN